MEKLKGKVKKIADLRFTGQAREAFSLLKQITQYHTFEKRDGGIMTQAYLPEGSLVQGVELEKNLMQDYASIHCQLEGLQNEECPFPRLCITWEETVQMMRNVNVKKAGGLDGVSGGWFELGCKEC